MTVAPPQRRRSYAFFAFAEGAALPGSPSPAKSSTVLRVDFLLRRFLRRAPAFSCLRSRRASDLAVADAIGDSLILSSVQTDAAVCL